MLKSYKIYTCTNGALGLHLSRAPWDPYPWVSSIQKDSTSYQAGLRIGDCLLELNGQDVLGMKISGIAALLKNHWLNESSNYVTVVIWRNKCNNSNGSDAATDASNDEDYDDEDAENNAHNINQQSLQKFANCLQHIAQLLECPVCLEVIKPPGWQCCNGHVLCNNCRSRSEKCPVCRVPLGPRGRCLLSDKLFTLLADSFPCDGVRSNRSSPKDRRKCSTEFHNQPKMAIVQKQQQQQQEEQEKSEQQGAKKAKDFLLTSLRHRRRKIFNSKSSPDGNNDERQAGEAKEENKHPSMQKQFMYDTNVVVVVKDSGSTNSIKMHESTGNNRKSSADYNSEPCSGGGNETTMMTTLCYDELLGQTATVQQCHCLTCYKLDKVAIVNNVTTTATTTTTSESLNKYILQIPSQRQQEDMVQQQQQYKEKYQNYQCPTGKLCCLNVNVMPHTRSAIVANNNNETTTKNTYNPLPYDAMTNNNMSAVATTKQTNAKLTQSAITAEHQHLQQHQQHSFNSYNLFKSLKHEWDILAHLTEDHQLPVNQYYAEYGQRIRVHCHIQSHSMTCLNLKGTDEHDTKVEKFFLACIPLEMTSTTMSVSKVAIFVYHLNTLATTANSATANIFSTTALNDEANNFETIIENPLTGIKWFGCAHPLTTPWSHIRETHHFLRHTVLQNPLNATGVGDAVAVSDTGDAFVIVVKRKLETKANIRSNST